jgi:hypothetical protein
MLESGSRVGTQETAENVGRDTVRGNERETKRNTYL